MGNLCYSNPYKFECLGIQHRKDHTYIVDHRPGIEKRTYNHSYYVFFKDQVTNEVSSVNIIFKGNQKILTKEMKLVDDQSKIEEIVRKEALFILNHKMMVASGYI